jgi:signal transduction histidine kinase
MEQPRYYRRRGGFVWPLILISAGVIFLLNNMGLLSWGVWDALWSLWPVLLIAIGLDILFGRRSAIGALIALVLIVALLGGAVWFAVTQASIFTGQALTTDRIAQELGGATAADVRINFGAGTLRIGALKDSGNLIEGSVSTSPGETVTRDWQMNGSTAHFELRQRGVPNIAFGRHVGDARWSLDLSSSVPMALHVSTGVGEASLDLSGLNVTDLDVNSGVGQTQIQLPVRGQVRAKVNGGIGQIVVTIPEGMAARIHGSAGLGGLTVSSRFTSQGGGQYTSANYATADDRVDLNVSGGIGQVVVR